MIFFILLHSCRTYFGLNLALFMQKNPDRLQDYVYRHYIKKYLTECVMALSKDQFISTLLYPCIKQSVYLWNLPFLSTHFCNMNIAFPQVKAFLPLILSFIRFFNIKHPSATLTRKGTLIMLNIFWFLFCIFQILYQSH